MRSSKSSLFLMEILISILFFSVAAAACIQLFVKAHVLDNQTKEQNQAVIWSQNLAELWHTPNGDAYSVYDQLGKDYPEATKNGAIYFSNITPSFTLYFNKDWELCSAEHSSEIVYYITFSDIGYDEKTQLYTAEISFHKGEEIFYQLSLSKHIATERGNIQ